LDLSTRKITLSTSLEEAGQESQPLKIMAEFFISLILLAAIFFHSFFTKKKE
jgi:hypothetical protein